MWLNPKFSIHGEVVGRSQDTYMVYMPYSNLQSLLSQYHVIEWILYRTRQYTFSKCCYGVSLIFILILKYQLMQILSSLRHFYTFTIISMNLKIFLLISGAPHQIYIYFLYKLCIWKSEKSKYWYIYRYHFNPWMWGNIVRHVAKYLPCSVLDNHIGSQRFIFKHFTTKIVYVSKSF